MFDLASERFVWRGSAPCPKLIKAYFYLCSSLIIHLMPRIDPPYPSFTAAVTKMAELRLPAYRHAHRQRYHPYAKAIRQQLELEDAAMVCPSGFSPLVAHR